MMIELIFFETIYLHVGFASTTVFPLCVRLRAQGSSFCYNCRREQTNFKIFGKKDLQHPKNYPYQATE